ncbi:MAG: glycosyltransferase family 1 protein [Chloroflexi bacterium]|nr:glycosyltransferase family 1 protein [Chloroflexota bacterium]
MRSVLFFRDFRKFTGGHLKVWDYFNHVRHSAGYRPHVCFSERSIWNESNPWFSIQQGPDDSRGSVQPDVFFLGGRNWRLLDRSGHDRPTTPKINLVAHVRHADPDNPRTAYLTRKAVRICVSEEVRQAVVDTGRANGPIYLIPNAIDLTDLPPATAHAGKPTDLLIAALKEPRLGRELAQRLEAMGQRCELLTALLPRSEFLARLNDARVTVFLPHRTEGFYLPALEGMALDTLVVCPDCVGNRSFCRPGYNCLRPDYTLDSVLDAAIAALAIAPAERKQMLGQARTTAAEHTLTRERAAFLAILDNLPRIW